MLLRRQVGPFGQDAVSCSAVRAPAREDDWAGRRGSRRHDRAFLVQARSNSSMLRKKAA
jgi:hypothetical protein